MRRVLLLALPLLAACQTASWREVGDHHFRLGNYAASLEAYEQAAEGHEPDAELQHRISRTRHFLLEATALEYLHQEYPDEALELLQAIQPMAPQDRLPALGQLEERAVRMKARLLDEAGYQANEAGHPEEAAAFFTEALAWDPELHSARERLDKTEAILATKAKLGEGYYFEGMDHLREDQALRARTSFMHAATLLGEDSLAESRLEGLTADLAAESLAAAKLYREAGLIGRAWVAAQDAVHLAAEDEEAQQVLKEITDLVRQEALLTSAEVAVRGGRTEVTDEIFQDIVALGLPQRDPRLTDLAERNQDSKNRSRYNRARAYELDRQLVHAAELYREILDDEAGFGWEDVELRLKTIKQRLSQAESAYQRALAADQAGDQEAYRQALNETVQASVDYADALARLRELHLAVDALEE